MNDFSVDEDQFDKMITQMQVQCAAFAKCVDNFEQTLGPLQGGVYALKLPQVLRMLDILYWLNDVGEEIKRYKGREGGTLERIANEIMTDDGTEGIIQDGYKYQPDTKHCYSVKTTDKEDFIDWAKHHPDAFELVTEDIHPKTREKLFNTMRENGEKLPEMVSYFPKPTVKRRKQRS